MRSYSSFLVIAVALTGVLLPFILSPALAVSSFRAGLKTGDRAYYELNGTYGFSPNQPETQMSVLGVSGTNITAGFSNFWPDGLITSNVYWLDVFTGQVRNASSNLFFAVTPGLQLYDPIFNGASITITGQQALLCGGVSRQVVVTQFTKTNQNVAIAWDQSTGAMCRLSASDQYQFRILSMGMKNTTIWNSASAPPDAFAIAANVTAALGLPLVALVLFVYLRRRRSRPK